MSPWEDPLLRDYLPHHRARAPRDLTLFELLAERWGVAHGTRSAPLLGVIGSKGKGTTCAAASFGLARAGARVVSVTSPHYLDVRERIRLDGRPIGGEELDAVLWDLADHLRHVPTSSLHGHLSLNARFLAAGLRYAENVEADVVVVEAGIGGLSDELSPCRPTHVACTEIFGEHLGQLGSSVGEIAADKLGLCALPSVESAWVLRQSGGAATVLDRLRATSTRFNVLDAAGPVGSCPVGGSAA